MNRKSRLFVVLLALVFVCQLVPVGYGVDAPGVMWEKTFGGLGWDFGSSVQVTGDGGYIITGGTGSFGALENDVYLVRTNSTGHMIWNKTFGSWGREYGYSVQVTSDGGYIITGLTGSFGSGLDVYLIKTDSGGNLVWEKNFGGTNSEGGRSVQVTDDGGYIVAGGTSSSGAGGSDVYLVKTDSGGNLVWEKTFGGTGGDYGTSVQVTGDGGYIITGYTTSGAGDWDLYLVKTDSGGNLVWEKTFGGIVSDSGSSVQVTDDGGFIITGNTLSYGYAGETDVYLIRTDSDGNLVWNKTFGGAGSDYGSSVQVTDDGGYVIAGHTTSYGAGETDVYLVKTDSSGTLEWEKTFGGALYEVGYSVQVTVDGGYVVAGDTRSSGAGSADVYLVRTDPQGEVVSQEETYSAWIVDVVAPSEVYVGEEFTVDLTVSYDFTVATEIRPGVFEYGTHETLVGTGTKTYSFVLDAPEEEGVWSLSAAVLYTVEGELIHDEVDWVEYFDVQVIALPEEGTYAAEIVDFVVPAEVSEGEPVTVELTVDYEFSESTVINPKIIDAGTGMLLAETSEALVGAGSKTYSFELSVPGEGAWALEASVWYTVDGELVHGDVDWVESSEILVIAIPDETYAAGVVDFVVPGEVSAGEAVTVELTVEYEFSEPTEINPKIIDAVTATVVAETFETVVGAGSKTYSFELTAPDEGSWALEASVWYRSEGELVHDAVEGSESFEVQVTAVDEAIYMAQLWRAVSPETVLTGESFDVELQVNYEFTEPTMVRAEIIDQDTESRVAVSEEVLTGEGAKYFTFNVSAPLVETTWNLKAYVVYQTGEGWVPVDTSWNDLFSIEVLVPTPVLDWEKTFGGSADEIGYSVQVTGDGGYIITGWTRSFGDGEYDVYLVKTDSEGTLEWEKTFGGAGWDYGESVQLVGDDGYIIAGTTDSFGAGGKDVYLVRVNSTGHLIWNKTFGGASNDRGYSVQLADGGYIIVGETFSEWTGMDVYLVKTDSSGNMIWNKTLGGSGWDYGYSVQVTGDGGYIITGKSAPGPNVGDVYLVKTDSSGNMIWNNTYGGPENDAGYSVQITDDGGYIITGIITSSGADYPDVYLVRTNSSGNMIWNKTFGYWKTDIGHSVQVTDDGGFIITGETHQSRFPIGIDVYLVKTDPDGNLEWEKWLGGDGGSIGTSVQVTGDGGYIITGKAGAEVYLGKIDPLAAAETYTARIVGFDAPSEVSPGETFTVDLTVAYEFTEPTYMTPGIYNVADGMFIVTDSEVLDGSGTKSSSFVLTAPEEGAWSLEAQVWFISGGDSVHSDVDWFEPFDVQVTSTNGSGSDAGDDTGTDTGDDAGSDTGDDSGSDIDIDQITDTLNETLSKGLDLLENIEIPDEVTQIEEEIKERTGIPGFPYEAVLVGLLLGFYLLSRRTPLSI